MKNKTLLEEVFTTVEKQETKEIVPCFNLEYMDEFINHTDKINPKYPVYKAVSEAMRESGLSFDFSYKVANQAVNILVEAEDWNNEDTIHEQVDSSVPVYNYELMQIYVSDWDVVDEAKAEFGEGRDSIANAQQGWYYAIEQMVTAIKSNLETIN